MLVSLSRAFDAMVSPFSPGDNWFAIAAPIQHSTACFARRKYRFPGQRVSRDSLHPTRNQKPESNPGTNPLMSGTVMYRPRRHSW